MTDATRALPLPQLWVSRARPGGPESRGAEDQALHIAEAMTETRPVIVVSRADAARQASPANQPLLRALVHDSAGGVALVRFGVDVRRANAAGKRMRHPYVDVSLHVAASADPATDGFQRSVEGFLRSPDFRAAVEFAGVPAEFASLITVQNQRVLDTPSWHLPLGRGGAPLDRADLVFHIPLGSGPTNLRWVTPTVNLLSAHVAAYQGGTPHVQTFLCFSDYTRKVAQGLGVPSDRICQFPVALPPGRLVRVERDAAMDVERIAWIGPADAAEKGLPYLVEVVELVKSRLSEQGRRVELDAYGRFPARGEDPAFDRYYDAHYAPLVARGLLHFHGFLSDADRATAFATRDRITVNASDPSNEGLGMAALEAVISSGVGYATRPGGGAENAAAYVDRAFVAAADTREALSDAVIAALDNERTLLERDGPAARHQARTGKLSTFPRVAEYIDHFMERSSRIRDAQTRGRDLGGPSESALG